MASGYFPVRMIASVAAVAALTGASISPGLEYPATAITNGSFELGQGNGIDPDYWDATRVPQMKDYFLFEWDDEVFHSGHRSVSISVLDSHPDVQIYYNWNQAPLNCEPGASYEITGWVRTQDLGESAFLAVQCWNRGMKKVLGAANTNREFEVKGTTDWVQVKTTIEIPEDTWRVVILAGLPGHSNPGGKVWFDDIAVVPVPGD